MSRLLVRIVDFYRRRVSPLLPPLCRFEPSCSAYAREALLRHGAAKGTILAAWRVLRCNPLGKGGFDPVPPSGRWRN
jgi:putative membrane protein insertion efficiency factor